MENGDRDTKTAIKYSKWIQTLHIRYEMKGMTSKFMTKIYHMNFRFVWRKDDVINHPVIMKKQQSNFWKIVPAHCHSPTTRGILQTMFFWKATLKGTKQRLFALCNWHVKKINGLTIFVNGQFWGQILKWG